MSTGRSSTGKSTSRGGPLRVSREYAARYSATSARATECVLNAVRLGDLCMAAVGAVWRDHDISASAGNVLMILVGADEPLSPHVVSERMLVTRGAVTGLLDALEKRGYARRSPHPHDRRMLLAEATPAGRQLARDVQPRIANLEVEWLECLSAEEQETFVGLSGKLQASLKAFLDT